MPTKRTVAASAASAASASAPALADADASAASPSSSCVLDDVSGSRVMEARSIPFFLLFSLLLIYFFFLYSSLFILYDSRVPFFCLLFRWASSCSKNERKSWAKVQQKMSRDLLVEVSHALYLESILPPLLLLLLLVVVCDARYFP